MELAKIIVIGLLFAVIIVYLQSVNKEIALLATIVGGVILLISIFQSLYQVFLTYENLAELGGINGDLLKLIIKITLICYLIEFSVQIIEDFGLKSLADKVSLAGKIIVLLTATPVVTALIDLIRNLV